MKPFFSTFQTVLFQGDSITDSGRDRKDPYSLGIGYASRIVQTYRALYPIPPVAFYNRGVYGDRICDILARYETDILPLKPDFISLLGGGNEVSRHFEINEYTPPEKLEESYRTLLTRCLLYTSRCV